MKPCEGGRGPTMSGWITSNCASGVPKVDSGVTVFRCTLERWHCRQDCIHLRTSDLMLGQTYRAVMRGCVAHMPG